MNILSNNTRLVKNTIMLFSRQILLMLVSLYTLRVVLKTLGAEDYGIYNVTAGIITLLGFLTGSMAIASQRFFAFELGQGNYEKLKKNFNITLTIYVIISLIVLVLGETIGLWFVYNKLFIPDERMDVVLWIYQLSIISFIFSLFACPFTSLIIAHEELSIYTYVAIIEAILKLIFVFILRFITFDKLLFYSILMLILVIIRTILYGTICIIKYKECSFSLYWDKELFKEIAIYSGWSIFGASVNVFKIQFINIILNQLFNPVIVAARSISTQIEIAVSSFSQNLSTALRPQIIKNYAVDNREKMFFLLSYGSKGTFLLLYLFALPLFLEMPIILNIWLINPPEYTVLFSRLVLVDALISSISYPLITAVQATGKIRVYHTIVSGILLLNIPVSGIILYYGAPPFFVFIISICFTSIASIARLIILKNLIDYSIKIFIMKVLFPIIFISILSAILPLLFWYFFTESIIRLMIIIFISFIMTCFNSYFIAIDANERIKINNKFITFFKKKYI